MSDSKLASLSSRPAGYSELIIRFDLQCISNWHESQVSHDRTHRIESTGSVVKEIFPASYWPGETTGDHLEFALKYDGANLAILTTIFKASPQNDILTYIQSKPMGKYARRIWFFYEFLTGKKLPLKDLKRGNYVDLLEPDKYFCLQTPEKIQRQRVNNNLLGTESFCPIVRKTEALCKFQRIDIKEQCQTVIAEYSPSLLRRALSYLYTKETKSSFEIEHIKPTANRTERFITQLHMAEKEDFCEKPRLIELQNRIVDPRFAEKDYRTIQNYVGETVSWQAERIHFACPKPEDLPGMMAGLIQTHQRMADGNVHPVIHAAAIAYGLVFLHPFEDGNGRIHRFLIHNVLACREFTPEGLMFPVSAAMLKDPSRYDMSLEAFSKPLMPLIDYSLDQEGRMAVHNDTAVWYRFIDMTPQVEALFEFIRKTVDVELVQELRFLASYDNAKHGIQNIVDMPDRDIDLFIRFCIQNNGKLSSRKKQSHFSSLTNNEIQKMEEIIQAHYPSSP